MISIALALLGSPYLLILDEPTANLDLISRQKVWDAIMKLKNKLTLVIAT
jgi:ABC-type multidrug transport system ATPase subunit